MQKRSIPIIFITLLLANLTIGFAQEKLILDTEYLPPSGKTKNVVIMFLGGSEGGMPTSNVEPFIEQGYPCFKIGYFGTKHTPDYLEMIPLEYFEEVLKSFD